MHSNALPTTLRLPRPQPKQILFLKDTHANVGFGGARGGGKSMALRIKAVIMAFKYPGIKICIVRTTYPELEKNHIEPLKEWLVPTFAQYNESKKKFTLVNGSTIYAMYCDSERSISRFNGLEFDILMLDEATHFKEDHIKKMRACVRGANNFPHRTYWTCNPDGISLSYVKRLFIDRVYEDGEDPDDYSFIQSLLTDNEILMKKDPSYRKYLESLPPALRRAWLEGDWNVFEGAFFSEFRSTPDPLKCADAGITLNDAMAQHRWTHVIEPFEVPYNWTIYRSYDFGYGKPFSFGYHALNQDGVAFKILEFYGCTRTPNEGLKWSPEQQFKYVADLEKEHPWLKGKYIHGVADPSIWDGSRGVSVADVGEKYGIYFDKGINDRIPGWMQMHERLKFDENGYCKLYFFNTCKHTIRTIPLMMFDEHKVEDLDTKLEDHACDEERYFCMSNPIAPIDVPDAFAPLYDPLDQFKRKQTEWSAYNAITRK